MSCKKTTIGGQALIEGIMMLGPEKSAIAISYSVILDFITRDVRQLVENQRNSRHKGVNEVRVSRLLVQSTYCHSRKIDLG